jgi:hypothetical protein
LFRVRFKIEDVLCSDSAQPIFSIMYFQLKLTTMPDLECVNCEHIKGANKYKLTLEGEEGKQYKLFIYDRVPSGTRIKAAKIFIN